MPNLKQKVAQILLKGVLPLVLLLIFLFITNPYKLPLIGLIVPFLLVFYIMYQLGYFIFGVSLFGTSHKRRRLNAAIFGGGVTTLALLQSIKQLGPRDLIIITILIISLSFYIRRIDL